jgi:acyl-coenzyme A thioesterase PaaI-like protein
MSDKVVFSPADDVSDAHVSAPSNLTFRHPGLNVPFADFVGLADRERSEQRGVVLLPERAELTNHIGSQHAGALFSAAEAASGATVIGAFGAELASGVVPLVRSAGIEYKRVARGPIVATGVLAQPREAVLAGLAQADRADFEVHVTLTDQSGVTVATSTMQWHLRRPSEAPR